MLGRGVRECGGAVVNKYGARAKVHWTRWLPKRTAQLEDPDAYFTSLGEQVAEAVQATEDAFADQHAYALAEADDMTRVGMRNNFRMQAEEIHLAEMVLLWPEPEADPVIYPDVESEIEAVMREHCTWERMPLDREHDLWRMMEDDDVSLEEFREASNAWGDALEAKVRAEVEARWKAGEGWRSEAW